MDFILKDMEFQEKILWAKWFNRYLSCFGLMASCLLSRICGGGGGGGFSLLWILWSVLSACQLPRKSPLFCLNLPLRCPYTHSRAKRMENGEMLEMTPSELFCWRDIRSGEEGIPTKADNVYSTPGYLHLLASLPEPSFSMSSHSWMLLNILVKAQLLLLREALSWPLYLILLTSSQVDLVCFNLWNVFLKLHYQ